LLDRVEGHGAGVYGPPGGGPIALVGGVSTTVIAIGGARPGQVRLTMALA
jgi:hypothetical protein